MVEDEAFHVQNEGGFLTGDFSVDSLEEVERFHSEIGHFASFPHGVRIRWLLPDDGMHGSTDVKVNLTGVVADTRPISP